MRANKAKNTPAKSNKEDTKSMTLIEDIRAASGATTDEVTPVEPVAEPVVEPVVEHSAEPVEDMPNPLTVKDEAPAPAAVEPVELSATPSGYVIEDNIPMPSAKGGGGKAKYPWEVLQVGQSFKIEGGKIKTAYTMASHAGKKHGRSFACRQVDGGVRIWRTA